MRRLRPEDVLQLGLVRALDRRAAWRLMLANGYVHPRVHLAEHYAERGELERASRIQEEVAAARSELAVELVGPARYDLVCFYAKTGRATEALRLVYRLVIRSLAPPEAVLHWSRWRRLHQDRPTRSHYRRRRTQHRFRASTGRGKKTSITGP